MLSCPARCVGVLACLLAVACGPDRDPGLEFSDPDQQGIVGGRFASTGEYPHQVSLQTPWGGHFCGGTFVAPDLVLTAAHCIDGNPFRVVAGVERLSAGGEVFGVRSAVPHPNYNPTTLQNDLAVVRLTRLDPSNRAIPLVDAGSEPTVAAGRSWATTIGWGNQSFEGTSPDWLKEANVSLLHSWECRQQMAASDDMVCAAAAGRSVCNGDSGGPLLVQTPGGMALHGVTSWSNYCHNQSPSGFAKVSHNRWWLNRVAPDILWLDEVSAPASPPPAPPAPSGDDHGQTFNTATTVWMGPGSLQVPGQLHSGDIDLFRIDLQQGGTFTASTRGSTDTYGLIVDANGQVLVQNNNGVDTNFHLQRWLNAGTYYVDVRGAGGSTGAYTLDLRAQ